MGSGEIKFACNADNKCQLNQYPCANDEGCLGNLKCVTLKITNSINDYGLYSKWLKVRHTPDGFYFATDNLIGDDERGIDGKLLLSSLDDSE